MTILRPIPDDPETVRHRHVNLHALRVLRTLYSVPGQPAALETAIEAMDPTIRNELLFMAVQLLNLPLLGQAIDAYEARVGLLNELAAIEAGAPS